MRGKEKGESIPAVLELVADLLEVVVAHVVDGEDEAVRVLWDAGTDVGEQLVLVLASLLGHLRQAQSLCAFGFRHLGLGVSEFVFKRLKWERGMLRIRLLGIKIHGVELFFFSPCAGGPRMR